MPFSPMYHLLDTFTLQQVDCLGEMYTPRLLFLGIDFA
jgi:hypothetical protein